MAFVIAAKRDDIWSGEMKGVLVNGVSVLLVNEEHTVYAYEDRCAHQRVRLSEGRLEGGVITCAAHGYQYDARTGFGVNPKGTALVRLPVQVEGCPVEAARCASGPQEPRTCPSEDREAMILVDLGARDLEVGPVLEAGKAAESVIAAIRELDARVVVVDRGSYLRVKVPERCEFTRAAVERHLGAPFRLPGDLERIMPSFKGTFHVSEDGAHWTVESLR